MGWFVALNFAHPLCEGAGLKPAPTTRPVRGAKGRVVHSIVATVVG